MITEKNNLKTSISYNDDKTKRYLLRLEWEKTKPRACIIMISPIMPEG